jgi:hypothetical protein
MRLRLLGDRARELHHERERVQSLLVDGACSRAAGLSRRKTSEDAELGAFEAHCLGQIR